MNNWQIVMDNKVNLKRLSMRANFRNWTLLVGLLCVAAACVIAYLITLPAEADVSLLFDAPKYSSLQYWIST
ncbi:hypothetical protein LZT22_11025 [Polynucleobacter sp. IMCC 29146]|nr:hypothetical protein [Polynucleobacter sp. IMCC 29146]